jgi:hypothetical protein
MLALPGCTLFPLKDRISQPGSEAKDLVSPARYAKLHVELDHPAGAAPDAAAIDVLRSTIMDVTGRDSAHVDIQQSADIPAEPDKKYTWDEIQALENAHRSRHTSGDTVALYVVYVAGGSQDDSSSGKVLGAAYHGTSIVMFKGNIDASTGGTLSGKPPTTYLERAVLVHEAGHAMGLVNLGAPMQTNHEDGGHPHHSSNQQSVMYWAVENTGGLFGLVNCLASPDDCGIPYKFDANDEADLRALRGS